MPSIDLPVVTTVKSWFGLAIAAGDVPNASGIHKFGHNDEVSTLFETIWDGGGIYNFSASAVPLYISSSNDTDTQSIIVQGLDENWELQEVTITLQGRTKTRVGTIETFIRVFRAYNDSNTDIAGVVYIYEDGDVSLGEPDTVADIRAQIDGDHNQTLMVVYAIPTGKTGYLHRWYISPGHTAAQTRITEANLKIREFEKSFRVKETVTLAQVPWIYEFSYPIIIPEKSDIVIEAAIDSGSALVAAGFDLVLIDND